MSEAVKLAPVQGWPEGIPWHMHLRAYEGYCKKYHSQVALIDLEGRNCRGGFTTGELDMFIPGWREELSGWNAMKERVAFLEAERLADTRAPIPEGFVVVKREVLEEAARNAMLYFGIMLNSPFWREAVDPVRADIVGIEIALRQALATPEASAGPLSKEDQRLFDVAERAASTVLYTVPEASAVEGGTDWQTLAYERLVGWNKANKLIRELRVVEGEWKPDREALMALVRRELTDNLVDTVSLQPCGKPDVLLAGCKAVGYRHPEMAASEFSGFVADAIIALKPSGRIGE